MAQFDVYQIKNTPLLIDVQSNLLSELKTRIVVPLLPLRETAPNQLSKLHPLIRFDENEYILRTAEMSYIQGVKLENCIGNLENMYRTDIINALDFLILGF